MRIIQLTPGAGGNFYCENCLRDNALVLELRRQGHDVLMVPLYLPLVTEGGDSSLGVPLFFGGINVYLQQKSALFRHTPRWLDRLLDARPLLRLASRGAELTKPEDLGEPTLSMLRGEDGQQAKELQRLVAWLSERDRPDVLCLSNALLTGMAPRLRDALGVPILCTLQDEDAFLDALPDPYRKRAWDLVRERAGAIDAFLAVSRHYAAHMTVRLGVPGGRMQVVPIGIDAAGYAPAPSPPAPPAIGYLAQMNPAGGLDLLVEAFLALRPRVAGLRLRVAGGHTPGDRAFVQNVRRRLDEAGAAGDADFLPIPDRAAKQALLRTVSVVCVPARVGEAFPVFALEAMAAGVPVVAPRTGALPEVVEETGGGVIVPPDDPPALEAALERLVTHPDEARALGARGREAVLERFSLTRMAQRFLRAAEDVLAARAEEA
jgi:glycosyltransferase involved in cell wall biosynthesis